MGTLFETVTNRSTKTMRTEKAMLGLIKYYTINVSTIA